MTHLTQEQFIELYADKTATCAVTIQKIKDELNTIEAFKMLGGAQHDLIMNVFNATFMKIEMEQDAQDGFSDAYDYALDRDGY